MANKLGLIVLDNCKELGDKINNHLKKINNTNESFIIPIQQIRFNNGEGKIVIKETIREKAIYILSDIGNSGCTYEIFNHINHMSPDEHFQDIKRVISAIGGNAAKIAVIMPLLYASRQHKRRSRESLDCAIALQELERLGVKLIVTFDAHDPNVQNAIPCLSFENFYPTHIMLKTFISNEKINLDNLLVVSPDPGAMDRARYYADILKSDVGMFYKRRDLSIIVDNKNPIVAHEYIGKDVEGKDIIIVDDMVASGDSMFEVMDELKKRKANNIFIFCTFAFFTKGIKGFDKAYKNNKICKFYTTNLSYIPEEAKETEWLKSVDCSKFMADIINTLYNQESISPLLNGKVGLQRYIEQHKKKKK
ncbi:MAG: ribose-phosphate pyrophosphokinase [Bacilli bacterium]|nr:ribose-phosphate pyrophosphokinase [Bacilli bacterium]